MMLDAMTSVHTTVNKLRTQAHVREKQNEAYAMNLSRTIDDRQNNDQNQQQRSGSGLACTCRLIGWSNE